MQNRIAETLKTLEKIQAIQDNSIIPEWYSLLNHMELFKWDKSGNNVLESFIIGQTAKYNRGKKSKYPYLCFYNLNTQRLEVYQHIEEKRAINWELSLYIEETQG